MDQQELCSKHARWLIVFLFRKVQHRLWLEREAIAQERFRKKKEDEERKLKEKLEQEVIDYMYVQLHREKVLSIVFWRL